MVGNRPLVYTPELTRRRQPLVVKNPVRLKKLDPNETLSMPRQNRRALIRLRMAKRMRFTTELEGTLLQTPITVLTMLLVLTVLAMFLTPLLGWTL